jgi:hypothetical protein
MNQSEPGGKDWRELCMAAATEMDPEKLLELVGQITKALDDRDEQKRKMFAGVDRQSNFLQPAL